MQSANLIHNYFSHDRNTRVVAMVTQVDVLTELAARLAVADYTALFFRRKGKLTPASYHCATDCAVSNPESIDESWVYECDSYFAGRVDDEIIREINKDSEPKGFSSINKFNFSCAIPHVSEGMVESVLVFFWRDKPSVAGGNLREVAGVVAKAFSNLTRSIDDMHALYDYSERLSRMIEMFEMPIENFRFKDFISELVKGAMSVLNADGLCLLKQDARTGKLQLQEVVARQKPERAFVQSLSNVLSENREEGDDPLDERRAVRDISASFKGQPPRVVALEILPDRFYAYELVAWSDSPAGFTPNDMEILALFSVLSRTVIRNAILIRHAKKAKRILERNSSLMADMETTAALADMTSGVAHEFNNIIGGVVGRLQLIKMNQEDGKLLEQLDRIEQMVLEGAKTVKSIQEYTVGAEYKNLGPVNIGDIVREAVLSAESNWRALAESKQIEVATDISSEESIISGNADDITAVIDRVMQNAVEFSPEGSVVTVSLKSDAGQVRLSVMDHGPGIPTVNKAKVFYPFFTSKQSRLAGLGLSVVHGIVTRHKGKITIKDNKPSGAIVEMTFVEVDARPDYSEITSRHQREHKLRVLVVDDDVQIREILRDMLSMKGHIPTTCGDGYAALEALEKQDFDILITDLGMPGISGLDLARQVHESRPDMPIAMITGWGSQLDRTEVSATGIKAVLPKPFHLKEIQSLIEELV